MKVCYHNFPVSAISKVFYLDEQNILNGNLYFTPPLAMMSC